MTEAERLRDLSDSIRSYFQGMFDVGAAIHPYVYGEAHRMAELIGIDPTDLPTEGWYLDNEDSDPPDLFKTKP